jgi:DNA-binding transcriptional ArsR family regulator
MPAEAEDAAGADAPDLVFKALADRHRRQILRLVQHTELPAGQIAAHFQLTQQAVSLHLAVLKKAGLLSERREGTRRLYRLRVDALQPAREVLDEFWPDALARLKQAVESDQAIGGDLPQ